MAQPKSFLLNSTEQDLTDDVWIRKKKKNSVHFNVILSIFSDALAFVGWKSSKPAWTKNSGVNSVGFVSKLKYSGV